MNKKALGPVIAISLLVIVSVVAVIGFQSWYGEYSSKTFSDVEKKDKSNGISIESISDNILYVKNNGEDNFTLNKIKIGEVECNFDKNLSLGINQINISNCLGNVGINDIILVTDDGIIEKKLFVKEIIEILPSCSNVTNGLVGLWHFDNNVLDNSTNSNHGTLYGDARLLMNFNDGIANDVSEYNNDGNLVNGVNCSISGVDGQGCEFDGINDVIDLNNDVSLEPLTQITINSWVKIEKGNGVIVGHCRSTVNVNCDSSGYSHGSWSLSAYDTGRVRFTGYFVPGNHPADQFVLDTGNGYFNTGDWVNIVALRNNSEFKVYINGVKISNISYVSRGSDSFEYSGYNENIRIGDLKEGYLGDNFNGSIDEISIYSKVLSDAEILELYNSQKVLKFDNYINSNFNFALDFDGSVDEFVNIPNDISLLPTNQISISGWFIIGNKSGKIIGKCKSAVNIICDYHGYSEGSWSVGAYNDGRLSFSGYFVPGNHPADYFSLITGNGNFSIGELVHFTVVRDRGDFKIYLNGIEMTNISYPSRAGDSFHYSSFNEPIRIGNLKDTTTVDDFNGLIDDIAIYNEVLNFSEIREIYSLGLLGKPICDP